MRSKYYTYILPDKFDSVFASNFLMSSQREDDAKVKREEELLALRKRAGIAGLEPANFPILTGTCYSSDKITLKAVLHNLCIVGS